MRTYDDLEKAVVDYCERHGHTPKHTKRRPAQRYIYIEAMDYTTMEGRLATDKSGRQMLYFYVDGKRAKINE